jgi:Zn-dependent peptidase ImmA (M78 family)
MNSPNIQSAANHLLQKARIRGPAVNALKIASALGLVVRYGPLPDDLSGFLVHESNRAVIGINSRQTKPRQTFTLAHEIGHFVLHPRANFVDRKLIYFRDSRSAAAVDQREVQANDFAANLLMPEQFIHEYVRGKVIDLEDEEFVSDLARRFGVSTQALTYRLVNLDITHQNARRPQIAHIVGESSGKAKSKI